MVQQVRGVRCAVSIFYIFLIQYVTLKYHGAKET